MGAKRRQDSLFRAIHRVATARKRDALAEHATPVCGILRDFLEHQAGPGWHPECSDAIRHLHACAAEKAQLRTGAMNLFRSASLRVIATSALIAASATTVTTAKAEMKIAVVDTQRAIMDTEEGLRAQATLRKLFDSRQRELDKKQEQLQKEREDIEKQQGILSKEALAKRLETWQRDMSQLQATFLEYNKELQKKQGELTQPIYQRTMTLIRRLATNEGYDLVVDRQAAPYVRGDLDVTDKLIQMVNSGSAEKDSSKSGKPADAKKTPSAAASGAPAPLGTAKPLGAK